MIKILFFLSIIFFASNCSLDSKTGIWSQTKKVKKEIKKEKIIKEKKELFTEDKAFKNEFNPKLLIRIKEKTKKNSFVNNLNNNLGRIKYDGNLKKTSRFISCGESPISFLVCL